MLLPIVKVKSVSAKEMPNIPTLNLGMMMPKMGKKVKNFKKEKERQARGKTRTHKLRGEWKLRSDNDL